MLSHGNTQNAAADRQILTNILNEPPGYPGPKTRGTKRYWSMRQLTGLLDHKDPRIRIQAQTLICKILGSFEMNLNVKATVTGTQKIIVEHKIIK